MMLSAIIIAMLFIWTLIVYSYFLRQPQETDDEMEVALEAVHEWAMSVPMARTPHSICEHIRRELIEIEANPDDPEEYADVLMMLYNLAKMRKISYKQLIVAVDRKLLICQRREWAPPDKDGVVEHKRFGNYEGGIDGTSEERKAG